MIPIWAAAVIFDEVEAFVKKVGLEIDLQKWDCGGEQWPEKSRVHLEASPLGTLLIPEKWANIPGGSITEDFREMVNTGTLRVAFWNTVTDNSTSFPSMNIPSDCDEIVKTAMLRHLSVGGLSGVHSLIPLGTEIISERLSEKEAHLQIEKILLKLKPTSSQFSIKGHRISSTLNSILSVALDKGTSKDAFQRTILQCAVTPNLFCYSVRWSTENLDHKAWLQPNWPWALIRAQSDGIWFYILPEAKQVEAVVVFSSGPVKVIGSTIQSAFGVDLITNDRLELLRSMPDANMKLKMNVRNFKPAPPPGGIVEEGAAAENVVPPMAIADAPASDDMSGDGLGDDMSDDDLNSDPGLEAAASQAVNDGKVHSDLEKALEVGKLLSKKLSAANETITKLQAKLTEGKAQVGGSGITKMEHEQLKVKLEKAQIRNNELLKKISDLVEANKVLKSEILKKGA